MESAYARGLALLVAAACLLGGLCTQASEALADGDPPAGPPGAEAGPSEPGGAAEFPSTQPPSAKPSEPPVTPDRDLAGDADGGEPGVVDEEELPLVDLSPIVVTATRTSRPEVQVPRAMNVVTAERVLERGGASLVDTLDDQIGVWVEKRTAHTSDLVVRGLSGGNLLALVDGNTLSTFWGEGGFAGDDMYGKIDPESIERIEVVRGPSSVMYGSNALGAVVNFITKSSPFDYTDGVIKRGLRTKIMAGTSPSIWQFRQEVYGASDRLRWYGGFSTWDAGGTRDGSGQVQRPTGGYGYFGDVHLNWKVSESTFASATVQVADNEEVYRYYRPTQDNKNVRIAVAANLDFLDTCRSLGFADEVHVRLYYQYKRDYRNWYDKATGALEKKGVAKWDTVQAGVQFGKTLGAHQLTYGVDLQSTVGESPDDEQFTETEVGGTKRKAAPDSVWSSLGVFVQDVWTVNACLSIIASGRFDVFRIKTDVDQYYTTAGGLDPNEDEFTDYRTALVGGLQANVKLSDETTLFGGWARGFRQFAPHFGISQHAFGVVVPSQLLEPVTADQFELGVKHYSPHLRGEAAGYYTRFNNFQNVVRGTFQGQDWYDFDGSLDRDLTGQEDVFVTAGNGEAYVYGFEVHCEANLALFDRCFFGEAWTLGGGYMWNYGQDETNDIPLRHTHPGRGVVHLRYEHPDARRGLWLEAALDIVGNYRRIPPSRLASDVGYFEDPQDPASGKRREWGLPGYEVLDLRGGLNLTKNVSLTVGVNNVLDELYRPAHARWDAPGRNVYAILEIEI